MKISREEIFGPVSTISSFDTETEAIALANDTPYGLAAYVYSRDLSRAMQCAERLEYGMVGVNTTAISAAQAPFGGVKQSGFGREGSKYGIEEYLVLKYLSVAM
jgi:succinate-semialdehyde dehydrogenase/glutarate-semialdehyde dehydrogenase